MTNKDAMFKFKKTQKFRVIIDGINLFTTAWTIRMGIGDSVRVNNAVQDALCALEIYRSGTGPAEQSSVGLLGQWQGHNVQIDVSNT